MSRHYKSRKASGFTLIDTLLTISIVAILAGLANTYVSDAAEDAKAATVSQNLRLIATTATNFYGRTTRWPTSTYEFNAPGDFQGLLAREAFTRQTAIGATENSRYGWFSFQDTYAAAYASFVDVEAATKVDDLLDDGDPSTGFIRIYSRETQVGPVGTIAYWLKGRI
jgi:type II secretory pathway pseudopilin PulG